MYECTLKYAEQNSLNHRLLRSKHSMTSVEDRLVKYRKEKAKDHTRMTNKGASFVKPVGRPRRSLWNDFRKFITKRMEDSAVIKRLGDTVPTLPVLGWVLFLKVLLWLILFGLFIELEFGAVYVLLSTFYFIYTNTGTGKKLKNEPSAYSVFNPNCERIQGSLTAEQFESEIGYRAVR